MYQSIPSLTTTPGEFFERVNSPGHKESAKPWPLGQKNRAKTPPRGNYFQKSSKKKQYSNADMFRNIKTVKHLTAIKLLGGWPL